MVNFLNIDTQGITRYKMYVGYSAAWPLRSTASILPLSSLPYLSESQMRKCVKNPKSGQSA